MALTDAIRTLALRLANNHGAFQAFGWDAAPADADLWTIYYTHNRDSDALARSNARAIARTLKPFCGFDPGTPEDTCHSERHGHWACGWVEGFAVKVWADDTRTHVTPAFVALAELLCALEDYPVLDESDFSREEDEEAHAAWAGMSSARRVEYIRAHRADFEFSSLANMLACARGRYFAGNAGEFLAR